MMIDETYLCHGVSMRIYFLLHQRFYPRLAFRCHFLCPFCTLEALLNLMPDVQILCTLSTFISVMELCFGYTCFGFTCFFDICICFYICFYISLDYTCHG